MFYNVRINTIVFISIMFILTNLVEFYRIKVIRATSWLIIYSTLPLSSFTKLSLGFSHGFFFEIRYFFSVVRGSCIILFNMRFLRYRITCRIFNFNNFNKNIPRDNKLFLGTKKWSKEEWSRTFLLMI